MTAKGVVRAWHQEEAWGVVDSPATPGGCWVHFSAVAVAGHRMLVVGQDVEFDFEAVQQDEYGFRGTRVWPRGTAPITADPVESAQPSSAYRSELKVSFDDTPTSPE